MEELLSEYMLKSGFNLLSFEELDDILNVEVSEIEDSQKHTFCPTCNSNEHLKRNGYARIRRFKDIRFNGKKVIILIKKQNYRCKNAGCEGFFMEQNQFFYNKVMTTRLREQIEELITGTKLSNYKIGSIVNLDEKSIRRIKIELAK